MSDNAAGGARASAGNYLQSKAGVLPVFPTLRMTLPLVAMLAALVPLTAKASIPFDRPATAIPGTFMALEQGGDIPFTITAPGSINKLVEVTDYQMPALPSVAVAELPQPSVETPLRKLFCVEYARARSGLAVFGDAKLWWARAKNRYARMAAPAEDAVMVFSGSKREKGPCRGGHPDRRQREIRVDQANWQNHGEIDHATPVLDVSARNDWSQVRVWDMRSNGFGAHVYAISGFIAKELVKQARND